MSDIIKPDFEKLKSEFKNKFTYASGYGVTMEPKSFDKVWIWIVDKISSEMSTVKRLQEEKKELVEALKPCMNFVAAQTSIGDGNQSYAARVWDAANKALKSSVK